MSMEVKLDNVNFKEIFTAAILQALDSNARETLIKGAVEYLTTKPPREGSWANQRPSPLEEGFQTALRGELLDHIRKYLAENTEIRTAIDGMITDAVKQLMTTKREVIVSNIADKILEGLKPDYN